MKISLHAGIGVCKLLQIIYVYFLLGMLAVIIGEAIEQGGVWQLVNQTA